MRDRRLFILLLTLICVGCQHQPVDSKFQVSLPATQPAEDAAGDYVLRAGDSIDLKFFYQPELNETLTIRPDGKIALQLVEEVRAAGRTPAELRETIVGQYRGVLRDPAVTVVLREASAQRVYVGGEVTNPGLFSLDADLTALQAIMQAGGLKVTALTENVVVLRNQGTEKPMYITLDLKTDLENPGQRHDIPLRPRDIVFVPKTTIANLNIFMDQYIDKMIPIQRSIGVFYDLGGSSNDALK